MNTQRLQPCYDVTIIGGGIHAMSLAAEACSRGLSVLVVQANDFAAGSSGGPAAIISGELQRLENLNLFEVTATLKDLRLMASKAPALVKPVSMELLDNPDIRSSKWVKTGISFYKKLFPNNIAPSHEDLSEVHKAFQYTEFCIDRNRLIMAYSHYAESLGASLLNYWRISSAQRHKDLWQLTLTTTLDEEKQLTTNTKVLINSTGWQVSELLNSVLGVSSRCRTTHVVSGRIIVRKPADFHGIKSFQRKDKSLTYAMPIGESFISIEPILAEEDSESGVQQALDQFLECWSKYYEPLFAEDIIFQFWTRQAMPEDYASNREGTYAESLLDLNNPGKAAVLLNVFGLCPSRHRKLSEQALDILQPFTGKSKNNQYLKEILPGADTVNQSTLNSLFTEHDHLPPSLVQRLVDTYGENTQRILSQKKYPHELGHCFGADLFTAEVDYLIDHEWVRTAEDILWRRTYLGLEFTEDQRESLQSYIDQKRLVKVS